jgi:hypothetical protein
MHPALFIQLAKLRARELAGEAPPRRTKPPRRHRFLLRTGR